MKCAHRVSIMKAFLPSCRISFHHCARNMLRMYNETFQLMKNKRVVSVKLIYQFYTNMVLTQISQKDYDNDIFTQLDQNNVGILREFVAYHHTLIYGGGFTIRLRNNLFSVKIDVSILLSKTHSFCIL